VYVLLAHDDRDVEVLGDALEPRAEVDRVADRGVLEALPRADRAHDGFAGVDADPAAERAAVLRGEPLGQRLEPLLDSSPVRTARAAWSAASKGTL
jgi:hypothetical protein